MNRVSVRQNAVDHIFSEFDVVLNYLSNDDEDTLDKSLKSILEDYMDICSPIAPVPKGQDCLVHLIQGMIGVLASS